MLNIKTNLVNSSLSFKSKEVLYSLFSFYDLFSFFSIISLSKNQKNGSFRDELLNNFSLIEGDAVINNTEISLIRAKVVCINNSFLYLDFGKKFNLVKPKFRDNSKYILKKELLFFFDRTFRFCNFLEAKSFLQNFQYKSIRLENIFFMPCTKFYFKILMEEMYNEKLVKFFFLELRKNYISNYQKKINFFQFNILFKKYKFIYN